MKNFDLKIVEEKVCLEYTQKPKMRPWATWERLVWTSSRSISSSGVGLEKCPDSSTNSLVRTHCHIEYEALLTDEEGEEHSFELFTESIADPSSAREQCCCSKFNTKR